MRQPQKIHDITIKEAILIKDVIVIGSGPAGYGAAIRASQLKTKALIIEKDELGGVCTNTGCIPTKALLETANFLSLTKKSEELGISCPELNVGLKQVMEATNRIVKRLGKGIQYLLKKNNVEVIKGTGRIQSSEQVEVRLPQGHKKTVKSRNIIIATGSVPSKMSIPGLDETKILTPAGILGLKEKPQSLLIIGTSLWGIELAFIFEALGSKVTYAQPAASLLPGMDETLCNQMENSLKRKGIGILLGAKAKRAANGKFLVETGSEVREVTADLVLNTDRKPCTEALGLEKIGIKLHEDKIKVNDRMETTIPGIYAVGDVTGANLAHVALEEGLIAAENAVGGNRKIERKATPKVLFSTPQMATVGMTEKEAIEGGYTVKIGEFPFIANGRAVTLREREGLVKVLVDSEFGEILGVHIFGPGAAQLISEATLAIKMEATGEDIVNTFHPHPTLSESLKEAFLDIEDKAIHK